MKKFGKAFSMNKKVWKSLQPHGIHLHALGMPKTGKPFFEQAWALVVVNLVLVETNK